MLSKLLPDLGSRNFLIGLTAIVIAVNFLVIYHFGLAESRLIQLTSTLFFFVFFLNLKKKRKRLAVVFFSLFILKDVAMLFYENVWGYKLSIFFGILAYATLLKNIWPKIRAYGRNPINILIATVLVGLNMYTLYALMDQISYEFQNPLQTVFFYTYGAAMMAFGIGAVIYNNKYNSSRALLFLFVSFGFILADVASLLAYYFDMQHLYYLDRGFLLVALAIFTRYASNAKIEVEEKKQFQMIEEEVMALRELNQKNNQAY